MHSFRFLNGHAGRGVDAHRLQRGICPCFCRFLSTRIYAIIFCKKRKGAKTVRVPALSAEDSCCSVGPIQVTARTTMEPQIIESRKLNFFTVRIDTNDPEIQYAKLTLCAYDEDRKLHKFLVYNGLKAERPPESATKR